MKIILREEVPTLGKTGEIKNVSDGYARNFLFPRGLAEPATADSVKTLSLRLAARAAAETKERARYQALAEKLSKTKLRITLAVGQRGRAFGSITVQDIADKLAQAGIQVQKNLIELEVPIKTAGEHRVKVNLPHDLTAEISIAVEADKDPANAHE